MAVSAFITYVGSVQTTNATPAQITWNALASVDIPLADTTVYLFRAFAVARGTAGAQRAWYFWNGAKVYREGGAPTLTQLTPTVEETTGTMDSTFAVSGNNLRLQVTGIAATTINWGAVVEFLSVS